MGLPEQLEKAAQNCLEAMRKHPKSYLSSTHRGKLMAVFFDLGTDTADIARKQLAILAAKRVFPLYSRPNYDKYGAGSKPDDFPPELEEQYTATYQIKMAEKVLRSEHPADDAYSIACDVHYGTGHCMPLPSMLADIAANRSLVEVSAPDPERFYQHEYPDDPPERFRVTGIFETAPAAAFAESCYLNPEEVDPDSWPDGWNSWIGKTPVHQERMQAFWEWYLLTALPEAWEFAENFTKTT